MLMPMPTDDQVTASERGGSGGSSPRAGTERGGSGGSSPRGSTDPADPAGSATALGGRDYGATLWEPSERSVRDARITGYAAWLRDGGGAARARRYEG